MDEFTCPGCQVLQQRVAELEAQVQELTRRLEDALRSSNHQAAPFRKGPPKPNPKRPGRKSGDQHGRHAHRPPPGPLEMRLFENANVRVAFSRDGSRLALVHALRSVKVWDTATGKEIAALPPQGKDIHCLAFSPDGARLVTVAQLADTAPKLPDLDLGPEFTMHFVSRMTEAQRAPEVKLWDLSASRPLMTYRPHLDRVESVAFSPDGRRLATASRDGTIKVREVPAR